MNKILANLAGLISMLVLLVNCNSSQNQQAEKKEATKTETSTSSTPNSKLPLDKIKLPMGFKISVFAEVKDARSMVRSPEGTIYVGNRNEKNVYAIRDENGDFVADKVYTIATGLNMPCGVAFKDGSLYVGEVHRIIRFDAIEKNLANPPSPVVVYDKLPTEKHHGWKYIAFAPDGKLYIPVGAPCNICEREEKVFASICRMNPDGSDFEVFAHGIRNSVGFDWHPETKELWFTSNGRDMLGDDIPDDELNHAPQQGLHFGYPYCHAGEIKDPEFGNKRPCSDFVPPVQKLGAHVAALGMRFYQGKMFPKEYDKNIFIAKHGSLNRSRKSGYNITTVQLDGNKVTKHQVFAEGWLDEASQKAWGRPVDVLVLPDGSMLVSDDTANVIYRIWYAG